jgi:hypothetical protein
MRLAKSVGQGGGATVCSCSEPLPCGELFQAADGVLAGIDGRSTVEWSFVVICGADRAVPLGMGRRVAPVRRRHLFDLGVRPCVVTAMAPMAREAAWVTDHYGQPLGSVRVSFGLHGGGREDARLW